MNYIDVGSGFPLLLGHSYLFDSSMWLPQIPELAKHYRVIAPDLWGHGSSPELATGYKNLIEIADDHLNLMDELHIKEFGILGLSIGGMWGAELAASYPERVKFIALMDTYLGLESEEEKQRYFTMLRQVYMAGAIRPPLLEHIAKQFYSNAVPDVFLSRLTEHLSSIPAGRLRQSVVPLGNLIFGRPDRLSLLENITVPSIVITGELDKPRPVWEGELMSDILQCKHVIIPGAGHISNQENPEAVTRALMRFIDLNL